MIETYLKEEVVNGIKTYKTYTKIGNVKIDPQNPRDISDDKKKDLKEFLQKYGRFMPFLVDARDGKDGQLIGGNKSLECMQELGLEEIWVEFRMPTSDADAFQMATIHNQQFGDYVQEKLLGILKTFADSPDIDLKKLDVSMDNRTQLLSNLLKQTVTPNTPPNNNGGQGYQSKYQVVVDCETEEEQKRIYDQLTGLEIKCKVLTI